MIICRSFGREDFPHYANMMVRQQQQQQMLNTSQPILAPPQQRRQQQQPQQQQPQQNYSHPLFREPLDGYVYRAELEPVTSIEQVQASQTK